MLDQNQMLDQNHQNLTPFYLYLVKLHKTYQEIEIMKRIVNFLSFENP